MYTTNNMKKYIFRKSVNIGGRDGFSLVEAMVAVAIFTVMIVLVYGILNSGQATWLTTDVQIQLQQNLRQTLEKVSKELRETSSSRIVQGLGGQGVNGSDILRFSMPVICQQGTSVIDSSGNVAYWGAPLTWGCTTSGCMDANDSCTVLEYKYVEYQINSSNQLLRRVLDTNAALVQENIFADNITDFQITQNSNTVTMNVTAYLKTDLNRPMTATNRLDVTLRNSG